MTRLFYLRRQLLGTGTAILASAAWVSPATAQSSAAAYLTGYRWDSERHIVGQISPSASATSGPFLAKRYSYNTDGQLTRTEEGSLSSWQSDSVAPAAWSGFTINKATDILYDAGGNKIRETVTDGAVAPTSYAVTQYAYDGDDRMTCSTVRMNLASLPSDACTLGTAGGQGPDRVTKNLYDADGRVAQIRKAVGTSLEQAYATYSFTADGKQEYVIDANGNRAQLHYDGYDRQDQWIFPSATAPTGFNPASQTTALASAGAVNAADYEQYSYDPAGNRTSLRKRDGSTLTYTYDALNRMTVKAVPSRTNLPATYRRSVYYGYDLRGLMTVARFDSLAGEGISTQYDRPGRVFASTSAMDGASRTLTSCYDADGNRTRLAYPDSTTGGGNCSVVWTNHAWYTYDALNRSTGVTGNGSDWTRSFHYNSTGFRDSDTISGGGGTTTFSPDPINRLASLTRDVAGTTTDINTTFSYSPASQLTQESRNNDAYTYMGRYNVNRGYTPNGLNQYGAVAGTAYCSDANGNLTADGINVYLYDIENRLVESHVKVNSSCPSASSDYAGALNASMRYDPMGRIYETVGSVTGTTRYLIDGDAMVAEYDGSGNMLRRYVHGADSKADDPLAWYEGSAMTNGNLRFLFADRRGSIVLTGDSAGNATRIFTYDEYGVPRAGDGVMLTSANGARFLYTGQTWIADLGMAYYKARIYSPTLGRFVQTDPIGYKDQMNLYSYVGNDPIDGIDFSGNCGEMHPTNPGLCKINPDPAGDGSVTITFVNDDPKGKPTDQYINKQTATSFEQAVVKSGVSSVNVNSTTGGTHSPTSRHYSGQAVDVNEINGNKVGTTAAAGDTDKLQGAMANELGVREDFGPKSQTKFSPDGKGSPTPAVAKGHQTHVHFSTQSVVSVRVYPGTTYPVKLADDGHLYVDVPEYP